MILCSSRYWGDGTGSEKTHLEGLNKLLHPDIYVFWTGERSITPRITQRAAESYRLIVGHKLFIWDNHPPNDDRPTMHLGPLIGRGENLPKVVTGYISNPMCKQNRLNRLPLYTCADYAYNPSGYEPTRSINQAIAYIAKNAKQTRILKELVETYPGTGILMIGGNHYYNPVREKFKKLLNANVSALVAEAYILNFEMLVWQFDKAFGDYYSAEKATLGDDLRWLRSKLVKTNK